MTFVNFESIRALRAYPWCYMYSRHRLCKQKDYRRCLEQLAAAPPEEKSCARSIGYFRNRCADGDRLPSTRTLAATFGLARAAAVGAYEELTAAGFLVARPGGSTYVEHGAAAAARAGAFGGPLSPPSRQAPARAQSHPLRPAARPGRPRADLRAGLDQGHAAGHLAGPAARRHHRPAPRPSCPDVHRDLREQLSGQLRRARGLAADPEDIFLFPSVSSALRAVAVTCG